MKQDELCEIGWQPFFQRQVSLGELEEFVVGRVSAHFGSHISFLGISGEFSVPSSIVEPVSGGAEDHSRDHSRTGSSVAVGDWFLLTKNEHRAVRRLERKTLIHRKAAGETARSQLIAANVDTVFVVSSCNQDFNPSRLERYLALVLEAESVPVVVLTKADLSPDPAALRQLAQRLHPNLIVETLDARAEDQVSVLNEWCEEGQTVALLGSSGVGKSTLANVLGRLDLPTSAARADDDKGRHTTTSRSMHKLAAGGWLIDNPGMRELQLADCAQGVADVFDDVMQWVQQCRFRDCGHQGDKGCAVEAAVESGKLEKRRLENFLKLQSEQARNSATLAERRAKDRKQGQFYKSVISNKQKRRRGG